MRGQCLALALSAFTIAFGALAYAQSNSEHLNSGTLKTLHTFSQVDGYSPFGGVIFDANGNLFGTSLKGALGCGTVFELVPIGDGTWSLDTLHRFTCGTDDSGFPHSGVTFDAAGNVYGTETGNTFENTYGGVYELVRSKNWIESPLATFSNATGNAPFAGVTFYNGSLYGVTQTGPNQGLLPGFGTVFSLSPNGSGPWTLNTIHAFQGIADGFGPQATLVFDQQGNGYGSSFEGGSNLGGGYF